MWGHGLFWDTVQAFSWRGWKITWSGFRTIRPRLKREVSWLRNRVWAIAPRNMVETDQRFRNVGHFQPDSSEQQTRRHFRRCGNLKSHRPSMSFCRSEIKWPQQTANALRSRLSKLSLMARLYLYTCERCFTTVHPWCGVTSFKVHFQGNCLCFYNFFTEVYECSGISASQC